MTTDVKPNTAPTNRGKFINLFSLYSNLIDFSCHNFSMAKLTTKHYWVYILLCENGSYYTGYTTDIEKRYAEHINGSSRCKYTRSFRPLAIAQCWYVKNSKSLAMCLENAIKKTFESQKEKSYLTPSSLTADVRVKVVTRQKLRAILAD